MGWRVNLSAEMDKPLEINGRMLTRNWSANLLGLALPMMVALFSIPFLVRRMGAERFGILSFAWIILGSFVIFDLGLGRATIKFVAECLGRNDLENLPKIVWTSVWSQLFLGAIGSALMAGLSAR